VVAAAQWNSSGAVLAAIQSGSSGNDAGTLYGGVS
jgi:hypothetical protein